MTRFAHTFKSSVPFWLSLAVYIWALEFQAVIALDREPLFDRILDCAAVMLTMASLGLTAALIVAVVGTLLRLPDVAAMSKLMCKAGIVISTAFYFALWLKKWSYLALAASEENISLILALSCAGLAVWAAQRYKRKQRPSSVNLPSLEDCFRFAALPLLLGAIAIVGFRVVRHSTQIAPISTSEAGTTARNDASGKPNVILIVADGLRAKSMSLYGYDRSTTPSLDALGLRSTVYTRMHSNVTATQPSMTTLLTGKHPLSHGRLTRYQPPQSFEDNLLKILKDNHYTTAAITTTFDASLVTLGLSEFLSREEIQNFRLLSLHQLERFGIRPTKAGSRIRDNLYNRMRSWFGLPTVSEFYVPADSTIGTVKNLLSTLNQPFFLFVHLMEPHDPYLRPPQFQGIYSSKESEHIKKQSLTFYSYYRPEDQPVVDAYRDQYDETIRFLDHALGELISFLSVTGRDKDLLLIVTSDHGESFEHGYLAHGDDLHEPSTHIPLIVKWPFQEKGKTINDLVQSTDIGPTILHTLGIPVPGWMDGQALNPQTQVKPSDTVAVNHKGLNGDRLLNYLPNQLAIWSKEHKMVVNCDTDRVELFNLLTDPAETSNLSGQEPLVVDALRTRLSAYLQKGSGRPLLSCVRKNF